MSSFFSPSSPFGDVSSLLHEVRANTYGQIVYRKPSLFGFFHNNASYMIDKRTERQVRLFGFVGYVAYSLDSGSLRRHKTLATIEEANATAVEQTLPARYYVTPRQMICLVCEDTLMNDIENSDISHVLAFVAQALALCAPLTARIAAHAVPGEHLRSL